MHTPGQQYSDCLCTPQSGQLSQLESTCSPALYSATHKTSPAAIVLSHNFNIVSMHTQETTPLAGTASSMAVAHLRAVRWCQRPLPQQHVLRLEVPVHHLAGMQVPHARCHL
jgi:hypothetical protein